MTQVETPAANTNCAYSMVCVPTNRFNSNFLNYRICLVLKLVYSLLFNPNISLQFFTSPALG